MASMEVFLIVDWNLKRLHIERNEKYTAKTKRMPNIRFRMSLPAAFI